MPDSHLFRLINGKYRLIHTLSVNLTDKPLVYPDAPPPGVTIQPISKRVILTNLALVDLL